MLELILHGLEAREIAARLNIAESTVGEYYKHLYLKTGVRSRAALVARIFDYPENTSRT